MNTILIKDKFLVVINEKLTNILKKRMVKGLLMFTKVKETNILKHSNKKLVQEI